MSSFSNRTILVVDKDEGTIEFITKEISKMGLDVHTATCGDDAIKIFDDLNGEVDIVLSDVVMPGMSGMELVESIAQKVPGTKAIMMSGFMRPATLCDNKAEYEDGFIRKPFSGKTLQKHIKKALTELKNSENIGTDS